MKKIVVSILFFYSLSVTSVIAQLNTITEGFETWDDNGWTSYALGAGIGWIESWQSPDIAAHTGQHSAYASINNSQVDSWFVSPPVVVSSANYITTFWEKFENIVYYDNSSVYISSVGGDPSSDPFDLLFDNTNPSNIWIQQSFDLSAYEGDTVYVAFRFQGTWHTWFVDDFFIGPDAFTDANMVSLVNPTGIASGPSTQDVVVNIQNLGTTTIDVITIDWEVNEMAQLPFTSSTLNLLPGMDMDITLGSFFFEDGNYVIHAALTLENDYTASNNAITDSYAITTTKDISLETIDPESYFPHTGLQDVRVVLKNEGQVTITEATVSWQVDGVVQPEFETSGLTLDPGATNTLSIGQYDFTTGVFVIDATVTVVGDTLTNNNSYIAYTAVDTMWESFEGIVFPPTNWSINFGTHEGPGFGIPPHGIHSYAAQPDSNYFGAVKDTLYTPLLDIEVGDEMTLMMQRDPFWLSNNRLIWKDGATGEIHFMQTLTPTPGSFQLVTLDLSAAAGTNYIGFVSLKNGPAITHFDLITSSASIHHDAYDLGLNTDPNIYVIRRMDQEETFNCKVKNFGTQAVNGASYKINLVEEPGVIIASANGVAVECWEEVVIPVYHTFTSIDHHKLYFEIEYVQDENPSNNISWAADVYVVPGTSILNPVGEPDYENLNFPFTPNGNANSLGEDDISETLYMESDFTTTGNIYGFMYSYINLLGNHDLRTYPMKVWIAQSTLTDLSGGYLPNEELTLVFDDAIEIWPGNYEHDLYIPFDNPIPFGMGANLVVQVYNYDPEWPPSIFRMKAVDLPDGGPTRTIANNDYFNLDPTSPPETFLELWDIAYTSFVIEPVILTSVFNGTVYGTDDIPIEGASVSIEILNTSVDTDVAGSYEFPSLLYNSYSVTASALGYYDSTVTVLLNSPFVVQDFYLLERPKVEVNAVVVGNNAPLIPLENVQVTSQGYTTDEALTNAAGSFVLDDIYGVEEYHLTFRLYGYYDTTIVIQVNDFNLDLDTIVMDQEFISPYDVYVTDLNPTTEVFWKNPLLSAKVNLQNDHDINSFSYTNSPMEDVWLGNVFEISEITTLTDVEIVTDAYLLADDSVSVDVFDVNGNLIASSRKFMMARDTLLVIDIPNVVVYDTIYAMVHWQNNVESTNSLVVDYSEGVPNTAVYKYPGQPIDVFTTFLGEGAPDMSFHVRVHTLDVDNPDTNNEILQYNIYKGMADEFPNTSAWEMVNSNAAPGYSFVDDTWTSTDAVGEYRYAVEAIYTNGFSEYTFSNTFDWAGIDDVIEFSNTTSIQLFPVPASNFVDFDVQSTQPVELFISMFNSLGQVVDQVSLSKGQHLTIRRDISSLPSGIYMVAFTVNGEQSTRRLVVSR